MTTTSRSCRQTSARTSASCRSCSCSRGRLAASEVRPQASTMRARKSMRMLTACRPLPASPSAEGASGLPHSRPGDIVREDSRSLGSAVADHGTPPSLGCGEVAAKAWPPWHARRRGRARPGVPAGAFRCSGDSKHRGSWSARPAGRSRRNGACDGDGEDGGAASVRSGLDSAPLQPGVESRRWGVEPGVEKRFGVKAPEPGLGQQSSSVRIFFGQPAAAAPAVPLTTSCTPRASSAARMPGQFIALTYRSTCVSSGALRGLRCQLGIMDGSRTSHPTSRPSSSSAQPGRSSARSSRNGAWYFIRKSHTRLSCALRRCCSTTQMCMLLPRPLGCSPPRSS
mmetsp:Transcript_34838/g.97744  ORF Transcript_34838/g.97744 Transcript_34838/m.97744 type:complete len:340 (-) Transcript_34838:445-1464(-)